MVRRCRRGGHRSQAGRLGRHLADAGSDVSTRDVFGRLAGIYGPVAVVVFVLICVTLIVVAVLFRARPGREPSRRSSSPRLEASFAAALAVVAGLLLWQTYEAMADIDPVKERTATAFPRQRPALTVGVVASRWNWRFVYPGGVAQVGDGRERFAELVVPAEEPVRFRLRAVDVAHAFWIPALRYKFDAIPGRTNVFDLRFAPGLDYSTARCSEFCGEYHDQMRFGVRVLDPGAFRAWLRARQAETAP